MKICVLGAGVIGVSTAYALGRLGHDVIVIDKAADVAQGASYANGAQLSYSYIDPLASPATLWKLPRYLLGRDPALQLRFSPSLDYLRWGLSFLHNCSSSKLASNRAARQTLSKQSSAALESFERDIPNGFKPTGRGKLVLAQTQADYNAFRTDKGFVSSERCLEIEPSLRSWNGPILGAIYSETDCALDTIHYCQTLKKLAEENFSVQYIFEQTVQSLTQTKDEVTGVATDCETYEADRVILCMGNNAGVFLKQLGMRLPIYPAQGYSLTLPTSNTSPRVSVTDLKNKTVYANLGDRFRIAGFVDMNQVPQSSNSRIEQLKDIARHSWPNVADFDGQVETWTGARPMMPSGVPVIGSTKIKGLYLNVGHGSLGYTFAAGSAMKIASLIGHAQKNRTSIGESYSAT